MQFAAGCVRRTARVVLLHLVWVWPHAGKKDENKQSADHSHTVVDNLRSRLKDATQEFKDVLTLRTENLKVGVGWGAGGMWARRRRRRAAGAAGAAGVCVT